MMLPFQFCPFCILEWVFIISLKQEKLDLVYIFYSLFIIWATDSGAYFIGRAIGKRKLWPEISPNKTIEGFIGGIISAVNRKHPF